MNDGFGRIASQDFRSLAVRSAADEFTLNSCDACETRLMGFLVAERV